MEIDLIKHILYAIVISLCTVGINATTWDSMIFHRQANWAHNLVTKFYLWIYKDETKAKYMSYMTCKPLFRCIICMASVWSIVMWFFIGFDFNVIIMMLMVCGINVIIRSVASNIIPDYSIKDYV